MSLTEYRNPPSSNAKSIKWGEMGFLIWSEFKLRPNDCEAVFGYEQVAKWIANIRLTRKQPTRKNNDVEDVLSTIFFVVGM